MTTKEYQSERKETGCIRCGKCIDACPMHLMPSMVNHFLQRKEVERLSKLHLEDCMFCGCCSYICPARIPLVERIQEAKRWIEEGEDKKWNE